MHPLLRPTNVVIAALGAAVVALGTVVAVDRAAAAAPPAQTASLSTASTAASSLLASGGLTAPGQLNGEAAHVFDFFTTDTKLTWRQIGADLIRGETLGQIAGARAAKVEADALAEVQAGVSLGAARGAITAAEATRLVNDARDAISVLMGAKLSALLPAGR
ncbi:MAG: hypothetical protein WAL84_00685 [Candidatus Dormiibacterota bacterium]